MGELIKIELKKVSLKGQIRNLIALNIVMFPILLVMFLFMGGAMPMEKYAMLDLLIKVIFMIWQSVLISSMIIDEFKTRTMAQLYTYPIKRSAIISSKLVLIFVMMLVFILITQFIQHSLFRGTALVLAQLEYSVSLQAIVGIILTSPLAVMIGMIPLTVGLWMNSTIAPILTSFFMIAVLGGGMAESEIELLNNLGAMSVMGILGMIFVIISIKDVTKKDLIV